VKYLFYFGHPAQYLFLRETIRRLVRSENHQVTILIKTKDVLEELIRADGFSYTNILTRQRGVSKLAIALSFFNRLRLLVPIILRTKPDLLVGTDATIAQLGKLFGINRITIVEDDYGVIKNLAKLTYPFTQTILCPEICQVGKWNAKKVGYWGYMKLGYLHPVVFSPDPSCCDTYRLPDRFALIRLARLTAYHDFGIRGMDSGLVQMVIDLLEANGLTVKISSEATIDAQFVSYLLEIDPLHMHHVLAQATLLVSDSQSMSVEAAMLGIPSVRYSDLAGRISVLEELEHTYALTYGVHAGDREGLIARLRALISVPALRETFQQRRQLMLADKINVSDFLEWFLENYPVSLKVMQQNPDSQSRFVTSNKTYLRSEP
jgi:uncharacterized protein